MPWEIVKSGDKYKVVAKKGKKVFGTHGSRAGAEAQLRALYAVALPREKK